MRDQEEGAGAGMDPQVRPEQPIMRGGADGLRKLDFFRFGLFLNSSAMDIVLVTLPKHAQLRNG